MIISSDDWVTHFHMQSSSSTSAEHTTCSSKQCCPASSPYRKQNTQTDLCKILMNLFNRHSFNHSQYYSVTPLLLATTLSDRLLSVFLSTKQVWHNGETYFTHLKPHWLKLLYLRHCKCDICHSKHPLDPTGKQRCPAVTC